MTPETMQAIHSHALAEYPRECCGYVVVAKGRERYLPFPNMAATPSEHFVLSGESYAAADAQGEITALVHSHPDMTAAPSEADRVQCEASELPWVIVSVMPAASGPEVVDTAVIEPSGYQAPLVGRSFAHGVLDCWSLCRDWYKREWGLDMPNPERPDNWWDDGTSDLYTSNLAAAGFERVLDGAADLRVGDLILMQIRSGNRVPNHAAVYIGDGLILHHLYGRLSSRDVYGGYWQEMTRLVARHRRSPAAG